MPRTKIALILMLLTGTAHAHLLDHEEGLVERLAHQVFSGHHLPLTLLMLVAGVIAYRILRRAKK